MSTSNLNENPLSSKSGNIQKYKHKPKSIIINEVQLILAEKRTSLASLRTGIAKYDNLLKGDNKGGEDEQNSIQK